MTNETQDVGCVAGERIKSFVERVERLTEEKRAIMEDIKEIYAEAKGAGFCVKTLKRVVALREIDREKREEMEQMEELYLTAIGEK